MSKKTPSTETLYEWDIDRLVFYIGELESQVSRLSKPEPEGTITVTLTTEQAETVVGILADNIDFLRSEGDEAADDAADRITEAHDEIVGLLPNEEVAP